LPEVTGILIIAIAKQTVVIWFFIISMFPKKGGEFRYAPSKVNCHPIGVRVPIKEVLEDAILSEKQASWQRDP